MTNPFHHTQSSFTGDPSTGFASQRRSSYASAVSANLARSSRPTFSHLLNPTPDSEMHNNLYSTQRPSRFDPVTGQFRGGTPNEEGAPYAGWPQQLRPGASLPWYSRAWESHMRDTAHFGESSSEDGIASGVGSSFLSPSYLRGSVYLDKLEEAHKARIAAEREGHTAKLQVGAGLASNGVHSPASKLPSGSHRGVQFEVVEKMPNAQEEWSVAPLPSRWNREDKDPSLEVLGNGYEVKHTGRSSSDHEACAIRADHSMPTLCGVYYFEVLILNRKREDTTIGIGFSTKNVSLQRAPGWEPESWGYHGDDGHCFASQNVGKPYGPKFGPGDTIGCLVNFRLGHALFTKNGLELGIAFQGASLKDAKGKLFPTVGLKKPGDYVLANFGQNPFVFDIDGYMKRQQDMIVDNIKRANTAKLAPPLNETKLIQQLVLQFLQHDGYVETARAFAEEIHAEELALNIDGHEIDGINIKDDDDANNRQCIRRAILEGDIDEALGLTRKFYHDVLNQNEQVYFRLRCRKFVEMVRKEAELRTLIERKASRQGDDEEMTEADAEDQMDTEEADSTILNKFSHDAVKYGRELKTEFTAENSKPEMVKHMNEIFALMAYPNPLDVKEVAHLLDDSGRVAVAEELNSAILRSLGRSSRAALENLYAQTCVLLEDLRQDGGDGAFITVQSIIDEIPKPL